MSNTEFDQALQTFFMESRELLEAMEESLLGLESSPDDDDAINAIFRAAHTIKGSGGLFGLDGIVSFTHVVENVLDRVRGGHVPVNGELIALLLSQIISYIICRTELDLGYRAFPGISLLMVLAMTAMVIAVGLGASVSILRERPAVFLRQQSEEG